MATELQASILLIVLCALPCVFGGDSAHGWLDAHATFYGPPEGTIGGACGLEQFKETYSPYTTALSAALFNNAASCGACYEIKCVNSTGQCKTPQKPIIVTATDLCPTGDGKWCAPPQAHFDLSMPAYLQIAEYKAGVVPVFYRRVPCMRKGGERFTMSGHQFFNLVTVSNVGGSGDVSKVEVNAEGHKNWVPLKCNWGEKWETNAMLSGKSLNFRVTTNDGKVVTSQNVAPKSWQYGQTFEGRNCR
ncbi:PREDICTED: expansin-A9-like [Ipomoea nil]|uniref:expansin-A9-like n=1 Tax=Ipomoea nil TaxID=35883 RepID=UPI000901794F|nr:PREDICTED: expansin-A9-like [Ipomoea nil]